MNVYSPKEYWTRLAQNHSGADSLGFAPVLHPGTPAWFNEKIDKWQARAWHRALDACALRAGAPVLDVGCGTGRWLRRFRERGLSPVGIDQSTPMLRLARKNGTATPMLAAELEHLPFANESFDCVSSITVVQHIARSQQRRALDEIVRVLRHGGYLILLEASRGDGPHVFVRSPSEWVTEITSMGPKLLTCFGQEYLFLDRFVVALARKLHRLTGAQSSQGLPVTLTNASEKPPRPSTARRAYWALRRIAVACSAGFEPVAERTCGTNLATHAVFVFRK
ncbi:MAG: class I SAM-dependent methyltransferase [Candidatus Acidiferrales bacterium]